MQDICPLCEPTLYTLLYVNREFVELQISHIVNFTLRRISTNSSQYVKKWYQRVTNFVPISHTLHMGEDLVPILYTCEIFISIFTCDDLITILYRYEDLVPILHTCEDLVPILHI